MLSAFPPATLTAVRRLIVNADDFGLTVGVNRAILEAHRRGLVTSCTLMANGPEFDDAVQRARQAPDLDIGCHVVLVDGTPILGRENIPSLLGENDARLRKSWGGLARAALAGKLVPQEIEAEATAQIRKLQAAGIVVSHIDTHKHAHMFPQVLKPLLRAARACGVHSIRNPFEPPRGGQSAFGSPRLWKRWVAAKALSSYAAGFRRTALAAGMTMPDGCLGIVTTGEPDERLLRGILERMPEGTWELVCHPGYVDEQLRSSGTRLRESRALELQLLTSSRARELLVENGIELASFKRLVQQTTG